MSDSDAELAERVRSYFPRVSPQAALLAIPGVVALDVEVGTVRLYAEEDADPLEVREAARRIVNSACTWIAVERPPAQRAVRRIREARELAVARGSLLAVLQRQVHRRAKAEGILALLPGQVHRCPPHVGEPCKFCGYFPLRAADAPGPTWLFDANGDLQLVVDLPTLRSDIARRIKARVEREEAENAIEAARRVLRGESPPPLIPRRRIEIRDDIVRPAAPLSPSAREKIDAWYRETLAKFRRRSATVGNITVTLITRRTLDTERADLLAVLRARRDRLALAAQVVADALHPCGRCTCGGGGGGDCAWCVMNRRREMQEEIADWRVKHI
ncbi:MAG TPA: hypothetical protein VGF17_09385, partial [Phytomonospora sp.]